MEATAEEGAAEAAGQEADAIFPAGTLVAGVRLGEEATATGTAAMTAVAEATARGLIKASQTTVEIKILALAAGLAVATSRRTTSTAAATTTDLETAITTPNRRQATGEGTAATTTKKISGEAVLTVVGADLEPPGSTGRAETRREATATAIPVLMTLHRLTMAGTAPNRAPTATMRSGATAIAALATTRTPPTTETGLKRASPKTGRTTAAAETLEAVAATGPHSAIATPATEVATLDRPVVEDSRLVLLYRRWYHCIG